MKKYKYEHLYNYMKEVIAKPLDHPDFFLNAEQKAGSKSNIIY